MNSIGIDGLHHHTTFNLLNLGTIEILQLHEDMADRIKDLPMLRSTQLHSSLHLESMPEDELLTSVSEQSRCTISLAGTVLNLV